MSVSWPFASSCLRKFAPARAVAQDPDERLFIAAGRHQVIAVAGECRVRDGLVVRGPHPPAPREDPSRPGANFPDDGLSAIIGPIARIGDDMLAPGAKAATVKGAA